MFSFWENGCFINILLRDPIKNISLKEIVSATNFYAYKILMRVGEDNLLQCGALFNQYLGDIYDKKKTEKLYLFKLINLEKW